MLFTYINTSMNTKIVPNSRHALLKFVRHVNGWNITHPVSWQDVDQVKNKIHDQLHNLHWSPSQIQKFYNYPYGKSNKWNNGFCMFLKNVLKLQLKDVKNSVINYFRKEGRLNTNEKFLYKKSCEFKFDPYKYKNIPGYELLLDKGIYSAVGNPNGVCRDHMLSVEYGWRNKIDPKIIAHPANCQFIGNIDNIKKGSGSCLSLKLLKQRINNWKKQNYDLVYLTNHKKLPKTFEHKLKLSQKIKLIAKTTVLITNGIENRRILRTDSIPKGYRQGFSRRIKLSKLN